MCPNTPTHTHTHTLTLTLTLTHKHKQVWLRLLAGWKRVGFAALDREVPNNVRCVEREAVIASVIFP